MADIERLNNSGGNRIESPEPERLTSPPSRVQLAALMSEAEESAPHTQSIRFILGGVSKYFLTVTYLTKMDAQPTWVLSSESDANNPPDVFWSIETENPEQIYNLILKRARSALNISAADPGPVSAQPAKPAPREGKAGTVEKPIPLPPSTPRREPGDTLHFFLNRYKAICEIGAGGMSRVYKAEDTKDGKLVAVKVLHPHLLHEGHSKRSTKRFEQEFKATMALGHDNIVRVYDYGFTSEGIPVMVMEFIDGHSLEQLLRADSRLRLSQFLTTFYQTCAALHHAHVRGVIHRDVKPSNIMMAKNDQNVKIVKLLDFGIAKVLREEDDDSKQKLTNTGDVFGSPYYMSPEQCKGETLDARSDIYSLGCVMYQSLMGKRPFEGENAYKTIYMHVNVKPTPFADLRVDISLPPALEAIVMKCLEKMPSKRYQTVMELSLELQRLAQQVNQETKENQPWRTRQTQSGTFYAISPTTGKETPANVSSVLKLLHKAGLVADSDYNTILAMQGPSSEAEAGKYLVSNNIIDNKTLHAAVQVQALIEKQSLKPEKAIIALHYCQRSRIGLEEALDELGWKIGV